MKTRPFVDADLPRLQAALASWIKEVGPCGYYHVGNIAHRIYEGFSGSHSREELIRIWEDDTKLIGFAYYFVFEAAFFVFTAPAYRGGEVEESMVRSAYEATLRCMIETHQPTKTVITDVFDCDQTRIKLLTQLGFKEYRLWDHITERTLDGPIPAATLPAGFTVRPATLADCAQLAAIRNNSFGGTWTPEVYAKQVMQSPGYRPERELIVVAPDNQVAAFTVIRLDERNKVGLFEPVGTHSNFRRLGLARALMLYGLGEMQRLGMERAAVEYTAENLPALALYRSLGFEKKYETLGYELGYEHS